MAERTASMQPFESWLEKKLRDSMSAEMALSICEIAKVLLREDRDLALRFPDQRGLLGQPPVDHVAELGKMLGIFPDHPLAEELGEITAEWLRAAREQDRIALATQLADLAETCAGGAVGDALLVRASISWMYGDAADVPDHVENALNCATLPMTRAKALTSLAVWTGSRGDMATALHLSTAAAETEPSFLVNRENRMAWYSILGRDAQALQERADLARIAGSWPPVRSPAQTQRVEDQIVSLQRVTGAQRAACEKTRELLLGRRERGAP